MSKCSYHGATKPRYSGLYLEVDTGVLAENVGVDVDGQSVAHVDGVDAATHSDDVFRIVNVLPVCNQKG